MIVKCRKGDQTVVLKTLKEEYRERVLLRNALKREFKQCQRLNHSGIVRYQGLVEVDGYGLCIEEEYVEGRTLQAYLKEIILMMRRLLSSIRLPMHCVMLISKVLLIAT